MSPSATRAARQTARKATRQAAMVRVLRACGTLDAPTLGRRLGVSRRTVYRDADALRAAGLPVRGTRGAGYGFDDAARVVALSLDGAEVLALIDALRRTPTVIERAEWAALAERLAAAVCAAVTPAGQAPGSRG